MTILIGDGKGGGGPMEVRNNRGQVDAQTETAFEKQSRDGQSYVWVHVGYDMTAADTILAVRNISTTKNLHITKVTVSQSVGTAPVAQHHVTNGSAALAGTLVTGVNLNFGSGNVAEADARADETTNSSQGTLILTQKMTIKTDHAINWEGALILGTNDSYGIDFTVDDTDNVPLVQICGYFEDKN